MKRILCAAAILATTAFSSQADIVRSDWKAIGDGRAFTDETTGIEWLKLTETKGRSIDYILNNSHLYEGFRVANQSEVATLFDNLYPQINVDNSFYVNDATTVSFASTTSLAGSTTLGYVNLMGKTSYNTIASHTLGYSAGIDGEVKYSALNYKKSGVRATITSDAANTNIYPDSTPSWIGVFMIAAEGSTYSLRPRPVTGVEDTWVNPNVASSDVSAPMTAMTLLIAGGMFLRRRK